MRGRELILACTTPQSKNRVSGRLRAALILEIYNLSALNHSQGSL